MTDRIRIERIEVFARHGVLPEERTAGQLFLVDVEVALDLSKAGASDTLTDTVDYGALAQSIHDLVAGEQWSLIERVAGRVADLVLADRRIEAVEVTVHKPSAPIPVAFGDVSVSIHRRR